MNHFKIFFGLALVLSSVEAQEKQAANPNGPETNVKKTFVFGAQIPLQSAEVTRVDFAEITGLDGATAKKYCEGLKSCWVVRLGLGLKLKSGEERSEQNLLPGIFESESDARFWYESLKLRVKHRGSILYLKDPESGSTGYHRFEDEVRINFTNQDVLVSELVGHLGSPKFKLIANIYSGVWSGRSPDFGKRYRNLPVSEAESRGQIATATLGFVEFFANQIYVVADPRK